MRKHLGLKIGVAVGLAAAVSGTGWWATTSHASDHDEAPLVKKDAGMDITDLYVFASGDKTVMIVCWAGFNDSRMQPDDSGVYGSIDSGGAIHPENALYAINIDNNDDNKADIKIYWRYGKNAAGDTGIQWFGIPGIEGNVEHAVETVYDADGAARLWSGHADDPFFFDAGGYLMTLKTGTLSFNKDNDFLKGLNVTAAAIEIETALLQKDGKPIQVWATASRKGG